MAMISIGIVVITAPLIGITLGGYLADRIPGGCKNLKDTYFLCF
jgi:hypothetical protein